MKHVFPAVAFHDVSVPLLQKEFVRAAIALIIISLKHDPSLAAGLHRDDTISVISENIFM